MVRFILNDIFRNSFVFTEIRGSVKSSKISLVRQWRQQTNIFLKGVGGVVVVVIFYMFATGNSAGESSQ